MDESAPPFGDGRTHVDGVDVVGSLSPSRAGDFRTCPLLYRLRTVDRLPERPSAAALRGTVVHRVLELLFDLPVPERTPERAAAMVPAAWAEVRAAEPGADTLFADSPGPLAGTPDEEGSWLETCRSSLRSYFDLEDPRRLEPAERETYVETVLDSRLLLRGIVDRVDVAPDGAVRVVDYKTGRSPSPGFEGRALFQMRFYALVLWRSRGVVPTLLQLLYLADGQVLGYRPDVEDLLATERLLDALWVAVGHAHETGEWLPNPGPACRWCSFTELCPAYGGTPPPLPVPVVPRAG
ncbi:RecB family exonuclease [Nocardioides korecus]